MARLKIFELQTARSGAGPAGADPFTSDFRWLKACGIAVERYGLDRDRAAFDAHDIVRSVLESQGAAALPLVLADGAIVGAGAYPSRPDLARVLGLTTVVDEEYAARLIAAGTSLGLALARHDAAAIEAAYGEMKHLGVPRPVFAQAAGGLSAMGVTGDPQVAEALDRLSVHGTLRPPGGACCGG